MRTANERVPLPADAKLLRRLYGLSLFDMKVRVGVSRPSLSRAENGLQKLPKNQVAAIMRTLRAATQTHGEQAERLVAAIKSARSERVEV